MASGLMRLWFQPVVMVWLAACVSPASRVPPVATVKYAYCGVQLSSACTSPYVNQPVRSS